VSSTLRCQACVRRCVTVTASTAAAGASVMPAGRVRNATYHTHTAKTRRAVEMASVLMEPVCVHLASEEFVASMVSSLSQTFHLVRYVATLLFAASANFIVEGRYTLELFVCLH